MAGSPDLVSIINDTIGDGCADGILITAILKSGTVSIDGAQYVFDNPIEFDSPIFCKSFVGSVRQIPFSSKGVATPYALIVKYGNLAVTSVSYEFGDADNGIDPEATEAAMIADYKTAGINISRMGAIEDLLDGDYFSEDIVSNLWGPSCTEPCGNLNSCMIKCLVPGNLHKTAGPYPEYYFQEPYTDGGVPKVRQRNYYLRNMSGSALSYNSVTPGSTLSSPYNPLLIFYWNASGKTLIKLS